MKCFCFKHSSILSVSGADIRLTAFIKRECILYFPELMYQIMLGLGRELYKLQLIWSLSVTSANSNFGLTFGPLGIAEIKSWIRYIQDSGSFRYKCIYDKYMYIKFILILWKSYKYWYHLPMTWRFTEWLTVWKFGNSSLTSHLYQFEIMI